MPFRISASITWTAFILRCALPCRPVTLCEHAPRRQSVSDSLEVSSVPSRVTSHLPLQLLDHLHAEQRVSGQLQLEVLQFPPAQRHLPVPGVDLGLLQTEEERSRSASLLERGANYLHPQPKLWRLNSGSLGLSRPVTGGRSARRLPRCICGRRCVAASPAWWS